MGGSAGRQSGEKPRVECVLAGKTGLLPWRDSAGETRRGRAARTNGIRKARSRREGVSEEVTLQLSGISYTKAWRLVGRSEGRPTRRLEGRG